MSGKIKKIISVVGARPNFMKLAPIEKELRKYRKYISHKIIHTGQHYDYKLSKVFFKDLALPEPDFYLGAGSSTHSDQTAKIMIEFEKAVQKEKPDLVIVYGDVNSTLACSLVCSKIIIEGKHLLPVAHVEAGLRSFDMTMPEEINRIITDVLSEYLFVTEKAGVTNLLNEGIGKKRIYLTGDVMIDSLISNAKQIGGSKILNRIGLIANRYAIVTIHRPINADNKNNLEKIIKMLQSVSLLMLRADTSSKVVFPIHPRTKKMIKIFGLEKKLTDIKNLILTEPAGYKDFIKLLKESKMVITDSGGIQEEATFLHIPCLTLRDSFERPETLSIGTNTLCKLNEAEVLKQVRKILEGKYKKGKIPKLMDGKAAKRMVKVLVDSML